MRCVIGMVLFANELYTTFRQRVIPSDLILTSIKVVQTLLMIKDEKIDVGLKFIKGDLYSDKLGFKWNKVRNRATGDEEAKWIAIHHHNSAIVSNVKFESLGMEIKLIVATSVC
ncbi:hypothetical protein KQX54_011852 [Cotesia glomerata]|uniref:Uncharacterized protein n=1 Tax=Cotesia glomerata TaxID=32391 RepID=A0AAV7J0E5_COTGL|nr:hypothetical protein KQX54_011852 [Cotesia glomerata]